MITRKWHTFRQVANKVPKPLRQIIKFYLWSGMLPLFALVDGIRISAVFAHDAGEWILTHIVGDDEHLIKIWWQMRKQI